ncbi:MAG: TetR family transcriptional regulator [Bacteroidetes bacterium]|nr:MAG: TetR family transcriptional regulator [Bacteroidota bacterium]
MEKNKTEALILEAAKHIFQSKGMEGARIQEIADEAGINKALLHYYYRSKENLFLAVFQDAFTRIMPNMEVIFASEEMPVKERIALFVESYIPMLSAYPDLPMFILSEARRDPQIIVNTLEKSGVDIFRFNAYILEEMEKGYLIPMNPSLLILNIFSLCLFPFLSRPLLDAVLRTQEEMDPMTFHHAEVEEIKNFVLRAVIPNDTPS